MYNMINIINTAVMLYMKVIKRVNAEFSLQGKPFFLLFFLVMDVH